MREGKIYAHNAGASRGQVLIPPGKNKTTTTIFETNLKQVLLNTGQDDQEWSGPYLGLSEYGG